MFYESYEQKILKAAKVKDFIHRFRFVFIAFFSMIILLTSGYLTTKGMITKEVTVPGTFVYGEKISCDAEALFADIEYFEFKHIDSDVWTTTQPTQVGTYQVRAVVKKSFGRNGYSEPVTFEVLPQPLVITINSTSVVYGSEPEYFVDGLIAGDEVAEIGFIYEDITLLNTKVDVDLNAVKIVNANGDDVTNAYSISFIGKNIDITAVDLEIKINDITKEYDGEALYYDDSYEIISGQLHNGDRLFITTEYSQTENGAIEIGVAKNKVISTKVLNANDEDVTNKYKIKSNEAKVTITDRAIQIKTPDKSQVYDGTDLFFDNVEECELIAGSLVEGHKLEILNFSSIKHAGTLVNKVICVVKDENDVDVTHNYNISYEYGTLEVSQKDIVVTLADDEKVYDAEGYRKAAMYTLSEELVEGDSIIVYAEASGAKDVGEYTIEATDISFTAGSCNSYQEDYNFIFESSTLVITPRPIVISPLDYSIIYGEYYDITTYTNQFMLHVEDDDDEDDWLPIPVPGEPVPTDVAFRSSSLIDNSDVVLNVRFEQVLEGDARKVVYPNTEILNAGTYKIVIVSHNEELNKNYTVTYAESTFTVNKRDVKLTAVELDNYEYNGQIFEYQNDQFVLYDYATGDVINGINGFTSEIFVQFMQNGSIVEPKNAGTYQIKVESYDESFNTNYNVVDKDQTVDFTITPCVVKVEYVNSIQTKSYDGQLFDNYDLTYNLISVNNSENIFGVPHLFNNDEVSFAGFYTEYINLTDDLVLHSNDAITAGNYILKYTTATVTNENGDDVSYNYQFECDGITLSITRRKIELTPNSDNLPYNGEIYDYIEESFIATDLEGELDIYSLINDLNSFISVEFYSLNSEGHKGLKTPNPMRVGDYAIVITGHDAKLDENFEVSWSEGKLTITPCIVDIALTYSEKIYDGTDENTFSKDYTISTEGHEFSAPYLYIDEYIYTFDTYLGDADGMPIDAINVGTYYLHVDKASIKVANAEGISEEALACYQFEYEPIEVRIIPRDVIVTAVELPSHEYNAQIYEYPNSQFIVYDNVDKDIPFEDKEILTGFVGEISVVFLQNEEEVSPINVGTYQIKVVEDDYYEIFKGNYNLDTTYVVDFEITPCIVEIDYIYDYQTHIYNKEVFDDYNVEFALSAVNYKDVIFTSPSLFNGDVVALDNFYTRLIDEDGNAIDGSVEAINAAKYLLMHGSAIVTNIDGEDVTYNYQFESSGLTLEILKRKISITPNSDAPIYNGEIYEYNSSKFIVTDIEDRTEEKLEISELISDLNVLIEVKYNLVDGQGNIKVKDATPMRVGEYAIVIDEYTNALDDNYIVTKVDGHLSISVCVVDIALTYSEKIYDGTDENTFSKDYTISTEGHEFSAPYLYNDEYIITFETYLGDVDGNPIDAINVGTYYLHVDKASIKVANAEGISVEALVCYQFEYEPIEVRIIPRDVIVTAVELPSHEYNAQIYEYPNSQFVVYDNVDKDIPFEDKEILTGFVGEISVVFLQNEEEVSPINVGTYQIKVVEDEYYEIFKGNYNLDTTYVVDFEITPCIVEIDYIYDYQTHIYNKEVFDDYNVEFALSAVNYKDVIFTSPSLFNGDVVTLDNFYTRLIDEAGNVVEGSVEAINAGKYLLMHGSATVTNLNGDDVTYNYQFESNGLTLEILRRKISLTPNSDAPVYNGEVYEYDGSKFIAEDIEDRTEEKLDISELISDLNVSIEVSYYLLDEDGNRTSFGPALRVGEYDIVVISHSEVLDENYEVSYGKGHLSITACPVDITLTYSTKYYDGTAENTFSKEYSIKTDEYEFNAPYLYNNESIISFDTYLGDADGNPVDAINVGTYYLHVDKTSIKVADNSGKESELVLSCYSFEYEPIAVDIIKRPVTIEARVEPNKVMYDGTVHYYNNELYTLYDDLTGNKYLPSTIKDFEILVYVEYYDKKTNGNRIDQSDVKNADVYYIEIVGYEFIDSEAANNFAVSPGDRTRFEIKQVEVTVTLQFDDAVFDGEVYDKEYTFGIQRTIYDENCVAIGSVEGLIGDDAIELTNVLEFYNGANKKVNASNVKNVDTYTAKVKTAYENEIGFTTNEFSGSVHSNYAFTFVESKFSITKRNIAISAVKQEDFDYCGEEYIYDINSYDVTDDPNENHDEEMDYDLLKKILKDYGITVTPVYYYKDGTKVPGNPKNVGTYSIKVNVNWEKELFTQNFTLVEDTTKNPTLTIKSVYVAFKPKEQAHGFNNEPYVYPNTEFDYYDGTSLANVNHKAIVSVYFIDGNGEKIYNPIGIYDKYEIHIESVDIIDTRNNEDVTGNYDIDLYKGSDIYLNIFKALVLVYLNPQESVVYGEEYNYDKTDITVVGGLEGSSFEVDVYYTYKDGTPLPEDQKYHPTNAGEYKIHIEKVHVLGKYPEYAYDIKPQELTELFIIEHRKATIAPMINETLTYNFDEVLPYTYSIDDKTQINAEKNNGILSKDMPNISYTLLINGVANAELIYAGAYTLQIDKSTLIGLENYELNLETSTYNVKQLEIVVKLDPKERDYNGKPLAFDLYAEKPEYSIKIKDTNIDITKLLEVDMIVKYKDSFEAPVNAANYKVSIYSFSILNYDISNFSPDTKNTAYYNIKQLTINVSYNNPVQTFPYSGSRADVDTSFTIDPLTPLVDGESITITTYYKDSNNNPSSAAPTHYAEGGYYGYYHEHSESTGASNYIINPEKLNEIHVIIDQQIITINLLEKTHDFDGYEKLYPTIFDTSSDFVYSIDGTVIKNEFFVFDVIYYDENGVKLEGYPIYPGTYTVEIDKTSIKTYRGVSEVKYRDYDFTPIGTPGKIIINKINVASDTEVEKGLSTYIYDATNNYSVDTYMTYVSGAIRIEPIYAYYNEQNEKLDGKPINRGKYKVKVIDCNVYLNGTLDARAKESIIFDLTQVVDFEITRRPAYLYVQSVDKPYDGLAFTEEIPVIEENFVSWHVLEYEVSYLDAPYYECVDVKEGGYRISIDRSSIRFTDPELMDNYDISVTDGYINITPRVLHIESILTFDEEYTGYNIEYTGYEWSYRDNDVDHQAVGSDTFKAVFAFHGVRDTEYGHQEFDGLFANEAYSYTITITDIEMVVGKRSNYQLEDDIALYVSYGTIRPMEIAIRTGSITTYYTGSDISYPLVELLDGYALAPNHYFTYSGLRPTIVEAKEGLKSKENNVPFRIFDIEGNNMTPNYYYDPEKVIKGTITVIARPITITTEDHTFTYNGGAQSWAKYSAASDVILSDELPALATGHTIEVDSKGKTTMTNVNEGTVDNNLTFKIYDANGTNVTKYYEITVNAGKLSMNPYGISVSAYDHSVYFNGRIYNPANYVIHGSGLKKDTITVSPTVLQLVDGEYVESELLYVGTYIVKIENFVVINEDGEDVSFNYSLDYATGETFEFEIKKMRLEYVTYGKSSIWNGNDLYNTDYYYTAYLDGNWYSVDMDIVLESYTILYAYDEFGNPNHQGFAENVHEFRIYDIYYHKDITESCFDVVTYFGALGYTDTLRIEFWDSKYFDNLEWQDSNYLNYTFGTDEKGTYIYQKLGEYDTSGIRAYDQNGIFCGNMEIKLYITDILDETYSSVTSVKDTGYYQLIIDKSLTEIIINGENVADKYAILDDYDYFNYNIYQTTLIVWPKDIDYVYDGQEIKYEGFGINELYEPNGVLADNHYIYIKTKITDDMFFQVKNGVKTVKTSKVGKAQTIGITDVIIYEQDQYGNMYEYQDVERNYIIVYYNDSAKSSRDHYIVNEEAIPTWWDEETGYNHPYYTAETLVGSFKVNKRTVHITTPSYKGMYNGEKVKFYYDDIIFNNTGTPNDQLPDVLPEHEFILPLGYWESSKPCGSLRNEIDSDYWNIMYGDIDISGFYEIEYLENDKKINFEKINITIGTYSATKVFDDTPLTSIGQEFTEEHIFLVGGQLLEGDYIKYEKCKASTKSTVLYAGETVENKITAKIYRVIDGKEVDVTSGYNITYQYGSLTVTENKH